MNEYVLLVDEADNELGVMEKISAHREGLLHRALSVFVFNSKGELLLQRRAEDKYHSGGLWTNTCCTHPRPGEPVAAAARRRLQEEMGMSCMLTYQSYFMYKAEMDNGLTEYELDHIYFGYSDTKPVPDAAEVAAWEYCNMMQLEEEIARDPGRFTVWFKIIFEKIKRLHHEYID